ncbi:nuclear speckle RNA-binding protein B-like [Malania oleifera]|uniref:nuclear speckle RNA-binding protein B-like n=1 Tax=Malania oleifera TaxID=397392 RepID=UPI0025ADF323|nr:nuclear speckle RNA-binding protein B-like [Malania oleifera]
MDSSSDFPTSKSPRRELQGPRPAPLKVRKDSYKIKKPPPVPQPQPQPHPQQQQHQVQQHRLPVIIYTVSPKVIHTNPTEFMALVQRLTGSSSSSSTAGDRNNGGNANSGGTMNANSGAAMSPAARFATIEKAKLSTPEGKNSKGGVVEGLLEIGGSGVERSGLLPGILSPGPASLQPIPANFFSPLSDPNALGFLADLSPVVVDNNRKYHIEGGGYNNFMPSPSSNFFSPNLSMDLFNNFFDL